MTKKTIKKAAPKTKAPKFAGSKTDFIKSMPRDMSSAEVVLAGKKAGVKISTAYVSTIRSVTKAKKKASKKPTSKTVRFYKKENGESTFRKLVLEVGVGRTEELLSEVRAHFA